MTESKFMTAAQVAEEMNISVSMAYKVIRTLNNELIASGYLVVAGRVSRAYFNHKVYGTDCA